MPSQPGVSCGTCPAYQPVKPGQGECHGDTPEVFATMGPQGPLGPQAMIQPVFPPVRSNAWCAKHPKFRWDVETPLPFTGERSTDAA